MRVLIMLQSRVPEKLWWNFHLTNSRDDRVKLDTRWFSTGMIYKRVPFRIWEGITTTSRRGCRFRDYCVYFYHLGVVGKIANGCGFEPYILSVLNCSISKTECVFWSSDNNSSTQCVFTVVMWFGKKLILSLVKWSTKIRQSTRFQ